MLGLGGSDEIFDSGNDTLQASPGTDQVQGGTGTDTADGGNGSSDFCLIDFDLSTGQADSFTRCEQVRAVFF
jgi:hypothetical protein